MPVIIDPTTGRPLQVPAEPPAEPEQERWTAKAGQGEPPDPSDQPPPIPKHAPVPARSQPRRRTTPAREAGSLAGSLVNDVV